MAYQQKPNSGSLFKNERKEKDSHPDYEGACVMDDGQEYWISAWIKRPEGKKTFMSLSFKPKQSQGGTQHNSGARNAPPAPPRAPKPPRNDPNEQQGSEIDF